MVHIQDIFKYMDIEGKIDYSKLNHKQKKALRNIIELTHSNECGLFFNID